MKKRKITSFFWLGLFASLLSRFPYFAEEADQKCSSLKHQVPYLPPHFRMARLPIFLLKRRSHGEYHQYHSHSKNADEALSFPWKYSQDHDLSSGLENTQLTDEVT